MTGESRATPLEEARAERRYDVLGALAAGRVSMVYLARLRGASNASANVAPNPFDTAASNLVALKRPQPGFANDADAGFALTREARFAARVASPSIVRAREAEIDDDGPYFEMEYVAGPSLARLQHVETVGASVATRVSAPVAVRIVTDILEGLVALAVNESLARPFDDGTLPIVHGDLSPANILVGIDGRSKISDFGCARASGADAPPALEATGASVGYSSPEAIRGERLTPASDVFAAGVILWELCAGRRLFAAPTPQMVARQVLGGYIPDLRQITPNLPPKLVAACERALVREKHLRFPSAADLNDALLDAIKDEFAMPRHTTVGIAVAQRCNAFLTQRERMIETPDSALQSGVRTRDRT